ncbi:rhodanese-like domain-containing protein, partial [Thalassolituus sp.]
ADTGVIILDVRHSQESNASPMVRARSVSLSTLRETLKTFERDFIYAIVGGGRAEAAAYILSEAGFDARVVT